MDKYNSDYLVIPEQIDELTPIYFDPTNEDALCFRIHINGHFFLILADTKAEAMCHLRSQLRAYFPNLLDHFFWTIEEVKKPEVFIQVDKIIYNNCIDMISEVTKTILAKFLYIQDLGSLHTFWLNQFGKDQIQLSSQTFYDGDGSSPYMFTARIFDTKGNCIKDEYFYKWFINHV